MEWWGGGGRGGEGEIVWGLFFKMADKSLEGSLGRIKFNLNPHHLNHNQLMLYIWHWKPKNLKLLFFFMWMWLRCLIERNEIMAISNRMTTRVELNWMKWIDLFWIADCFGMNGGGGGGGGGGSYLPSLSIHSQSHCMSSPSSRISPRSPVSTSGSESGERYSRKVFVGGLPPDIDEGDHLNQPSTILITIANHPSWPTLT